MVGGRKLLEVFKFNKTLDHIELNGNDIPAELKKSIGKLKMEAKLLRGSARLFSSILRQLTE